MDELYNPQDRKLSSRHQISSWLLCGFLAISLFLASGWPNWSSDAREIAVVASPLWCPVIGSSPDSQQRPT